MPGDSSPGMFLCHFLHQQGLELFLTVNFLKEAVEVTSKKVRITITGKNKSALLRTTGGFLFSYIFEDGRLFGDNSKVIEGVSGKILNDNELLLKQGDKEIIFKLEKDMTGYNILPEE